MARYRTVHFASFPFFHHSPMKSHRRLSSLENPVNFLVVILSDDTRSAGIMIPEKFTEKHGKDLLERVTLKVPNGDVWQVDLKRSTSEIWLRNGWWEFAEHYGIKFGHLLMFKYEGLSIFGVIIFNASASEIEYPKNTDDLRNSVNEESSKRETKAVKSEDDTVSLKSEDEEYEIKFNDEGECSRKREREENRENGKIALEKAEANFKCDRHYAMVYMHKSYFARSGIVLPVKLRRILLRGHRNHCKCLLLHEIDGKQNIWEAVLHNAYMGNADWLMFVEDNGIKFGDICVFELIHKDHNVLNVTILRS